MIYMPDNLGRWEIKIHVGDMRNDHGAGRNTDTDILIVTDNIEQKELDDAYEQHLHGRDASLPYSIPEAEWLAEEIALSRVDKQLGYPLYDITVIDAKLTRGNPVDCPLEHLSDDADDGVNPIVTNWIVGQPSFGFAHGIFVTDSFQLMERPDGYNTGSVLTWDAMGINIPWPEGKTAREAVDLWMEG